MASRITAHLHIHCPVCSKDLSQAKTLINHLKTQHQMVVPSRQAGPKRPRDPAYDFVKPHEDAQLDRYSCPSCWSHFPDVHELESHLEWHANQGDSNMGESSGHQEADDEYDEEAAIGRGNDKETDNDSVYLQKSKELFDTLDDLVAGFKRLLPYGYKNDKKGGK